MTQVYADGARVYDALNRHKDYAAASAMLCRAVHRSVPHATTLLDVGCGTGLHLSHLRNDFSVEGLDLSPEMLDVARRRCPDVLFHEGTLVDFQLGKQFDVVTCLFGTIGYALTSADLRRAVRSMANHLQPGGALIVEPWIAPDRFITDKVVFDSVNDHELKVARMYVTAREGQIAIYNQHYLVTTTDGVVKYFTEHEELGLFTDEEYRTSFHDGGLDVVETSDLFGYGLYVCRAR